MATYLMQEILPAEAWQAILEGKMNPNPFSAPEVMGKALESVGGKLLGLWASLEDCTLVFLAELPSDVDAASVSLRYVQRSGYHPIRITPLLSPGEIVSAASKAVALPKPYKVQGSDR